MIEQAKAVAARLREGWTYGLLSEAADTIDALIAEVENLRAYAKHERSLGAEQFAQEVHDTRQENESLRGALETLKIALRVGMPEYSYEDWLDIIDTALHSATRSADSAEPFCDTTPNHFCGNRWVHLPRGEQCDKCGGEV